MNFLNSEQKFDRLDIVMTLFFTLLGLINGQVSVFYIIYLFWFQELIRTVITYIFCQRNSSTKFAANEFLGSLFMLFIYFIFIIVLFGFMLNWGTINLFALNMEVLLFRNLFFNLSILFFALEYVLFIKTNPKEVRIEDVKSFNVRHIILHISIVVGGLIQFFVVKKYPELFTPDNILASIAVVAPFLLLRILFSPKKNSIAS